MFKNKDVDRALLEKPPESVYKTYPGSERGPLPEDDVDAYSKWFVENQPTWAYDD